MTVSELIKRLQEFSGELEVVIDEDGLDKLQILGDDRDKMLDLVGEIELPPDHL